MELEEQGVQRVKVVQGQMPAPSPVFAEEWVCCPGSTSPRSGGKCLKHRRFFFH